jgi:hypothetical protein
VLPKDAPAMVARIGPVRHASAIGEVDATVYRNDHIPPGDTGAITVYAARPDLLTTLAGAMTAGASSPPPPPAIPPWCSAPQRPASSAWTAPTAPPKCGAAGTGSPWSASWRLSRSPRELDRAALVGFPVAHELLGATRGHIGLRFLAEALLLSLLGGTAGVAAGWLLTTVYAHQRHWAATPPPWPAGWPPPWPSASPPACTRPSAPPA